MQHIELNVEERDVLAEVLQRALMELEGEIAHTDTHNFKELLRHRHDVLEHLQSKLAPLTVTTR